MASKDNASEDAQNAPGQPKALPLHCGPFLESAPFPQTAPGFIILRLPQCPRSHEGRMRVRASIRRWLAEWANTPVALQETACGPQVHGLVRGHRIFLSLSYASKDAWVAIALDQRIGLDAVALADCNGWEDIAPVYLGAEIAGAIAKSDAPKTAFAQHWATLEARCKNAGLPLQEDSAPPQITVFSYSTGDIVLAVAFEPAPKFSLSLK